MSVTYTVCVDWDNDGSFATAGDDISAYVKSVTARIGITYEDARVADIGQCAIVLNNDDRRFSPANSGSPLYGKLLPNLPVRVQATEGGSTWTLFRGHIRSIEPDAGTQSERETRITCEDALSTLHRATCAITMQEDAQAEDIIRLVLNQVFGADYATGTVTFSGAPSAGDTVTIGGVEFEFVSGTPATAYEVEINSGHGTAQNLCDTINALVNQSAYVASAGVSAYKSTLDVVLRALEPGTYANSVSLSESATNVTVSGATLSGGTDEPSGLTSLEAGKQTFTVAGDLWAEESTRAIHAISDCVYSEYGLFWVARDGTLTFKNREYEFAAPQTAATLTIDGHHTQQYGAIDEMRIKNRIVVNYQPRVKDVSNTVVAQASSIITVPGTSGTERYNRAQGYVGTTTSDPTLDTLTAGDKLVRLPFRDVDTGVVIGATDLVTPVPNTDFTISEFYDGTGVDYTTLGYVDISMIATGAGVEVSFVNTATGNLYVRDFQVRGKAIVAFDDVQEIREDTTSITNYGRREYTYSLPLESDAVFPESLATYLLSRYKTPSYTVSMLGFIDDDANGTSVLSVEIGDIVTVSETQTGVSGLKYLVTGIEYDISGSGADVRTTFYVRPLDDVTYWILGDGTYGVLGSTTRPAI